MYKKMYFTLFNSITDALEQLEQGDFLRAMDLLKNAQLRTEEIYIRSGSPLLEQAPSPGRKWPDRGLRPPFPPDFPQIFPRFPPGSP